MHGGSRRCIEAARVFAFIGYAFDFRIGQVRCAIHGVGNASVATLPDLVQSISRAAGASMILIFMVASFVRTLPTFVDRQVDPAFG